MATPGNYMGCQVYIYGANGNELVKTTVCEYRRDVMVILVPSIPNAEEIVGFVNVLILTGNGVDEYRGKLRRSVTDPTNTEIALSNGKTKEDRASKRYPVNINGSVESMIVDGCSVPMQGPVTVLLVNLSTSGILLRAATGCFSARCLLGLSLNIDGKITPLRGKVVWIKSLDHAISEYGCEFVE